MWDILYAVNPSEFTSQSCVQLWNLFPGDKKVSVFISATCHKRSGRTDVRKEKKKSQICYLPSVIEYNKYEDTTQSFFQQGESGFKLFK